MDDNNKLSCDLCGEDAVTLREISRGGWGGVIICSACFAGTGEARECDFSDFPVVQEHQK